MVRVRVRVGWFEIGAKLKESLEPILKGISVLHKCACRYVVHSGAPPIVAPRAVGHSCCLQNNLDYPYKNTCVLSYA